MTNRSTGPADDVVENIAASFRAYDRDLYRFLRRLGSRESTEDIAQEVYLRLLRFGTAHEDPPKAYLYKIARNVLYDEWQRRSREQITFDSSLVERCSEGSSPDHGAGREPTPSWHASHVTVGDVAEQICNSRELEHMLRQLPKTHRDVLVLRKREGMSYAEIAQTLGLSIHTVKKYVRLASAQCRSIRMQTYTQ